MQKVSWRFLILFPMALVYLLALFFLPKEVFWSPDEGNRLIMARSLPLLGPPDLARAYPGARLDPGFQYFPSVLNSFQLTYPVLVPDGSVYYPWPTFFPWLAGLLERVFGSLGLYLVPWLCGLAVSLLSGFLADRFTPGAGWATALAVGLATPVFFYSFTFWDHTLAVLMALGAATLLSGRSASAPLRWIPALLLLLAVAYLRKEMAVFLLACGAAWGAAWLIFRPRRAGPTSLPKTGLVSHWPRIGLLVLISGLLILTAANFASLLTPRHLIELRNFGLDLQSAGWMNGLLVSLQNGLAQFPFMLMNFTGEDGFPAPAGWTLLGLAAVLLLWTAPWVKPGRLEAAITFPALLILAFLTGAAVLSPTPYRALHGVFLPAPFLALAGYALPGAIQQRRRGLVFLILAALFFLVGGILIILLLRGRDGSFWPGLEWGPRYLLAVYPLLSILAITGIRAYTQSGRPCQTRTLFLACAVLLILEGALIQARGLAVLYEQKHQLAAYQAVLLEISPTTPVVTDTWWVPASLAEFFTSRELYSIPTPHSLSAWCELAAAQGVERFVFVSDTSWHPDQQTLTTLQITPVRQQALNNLLFTEYRFKP